MSSGENPEECVICGRTGGCGEGLYLRGWFICGNCEAGLVRSGCDSLLYGFYVRGLKKIWRCILA